MESTKHCLLRILSKLTILTIILWPTSLSSASYSVLWLSSIHNFSRISSDFSLFSWDWIPYSSRLCWHARKIRMGKENGHSEAMRSSKNDNVFLHSFLHSFCSLCFLSSISLGILSESSLPSWVEQSTVSLWYYWWWIGSIGDLDI